MTETKNKLDFRKINVGDKELYESYLSRAGERGCEYSFANLYLWGRQRIAELDGNILFFSQFDRRSVYPFPIGEGDKKRAIDAIIEDARARDIPCRITGLRPDDRRFLEENYPERFRFHCDEGSFDYVYDVNDLADLVGKKYHAKRNHLNRFYEAHPDYRVESLTESNRECAMQMINDWYAARLAENPNGDYHMEHAAIEKAFRDFDALGLYGLLIADGDRVLAVTVGSRMSADTVDVHFEKARPDALGAYPAINNEFAKYIRETLPEVRFLDREEDMGLEGLRKAKRSYYPHHMVKKCWACLLEDGYDY